MSRGRLLVLALILVVIIAGLIFVVSSNQPGSNGLFIKTLF